MKDWHVGQRVVCISEFEMKKIDIHNTIFPCRGQILTIRQIILGYNSVSFLFEEIVNKAQEWLEGLSEASFRDFRFRPLDESRLDQFRVHLNPKKVEEPA